MFLHIRRHDCVLHDFRETLKTLFDTLVLLYIHIPLKIILMATSTRSASAAPTGRGRATRSTACWWRLMPSPFFRKLLKSFSKVFLYARIFLLLSRLFPRLFGKLLETP